MALLAVLAQAKGLRHKLLSRGRGRLVAAQEWRGKRKRGKSKSKRKSGEGIFLAPFASRVLKMLKYHSACSVKSLSLCPIPLPQSLPMLGVGWWKDRGRGRSRGWGS